MSEQSDYMKYRGKCKEMSEALVKENPKLRLVRGHYYCSAWGEQPHWWCVDEEGNITDPTAKQFPSKGHGAYVEFDGWLHCDNCGKELHEKDAMFIGNGNYGMCSNQCAMRFVGL